MKGFLMALANNRNDQSSGDNSPIASLNTAGIVRIGKAIKDVGVVNIIALYLVWSLVSGLQTDIKRISESLNSISRSLEAIKTLEGHRE